MNEIIEFLTSKEVIVVYIVAAIACFLAFIVYLVDKTYDKRKRKHNTRELNKLVEEVNEVINEEKANTAINNQVVPQEVSNELQQEEPIIIMTTEKQMPTTSVVPENLTASNLDNTPKIQESIPEPQVVNHQEEVLEYTTIEPDREEAKLELKKIAQEMEQRESEENKEEDIIQLTSYEEEQETNAIISLEELVRKSKEMYAANELSQYSDEGNEPISLQDLEKRNITKDNASYYEPFIIENVVPAATESELTEMAEKGEVSTIEPPKTSETKQLRLDDFNTVNIEKPTMAYQNKTKFKSSPVISPIYGIEKIEPVANDIELENTANYDKLDEEIRKTNEFLMTLKELQKHLD